MIKISEFIINWSKATEPTNKSFKIVYPIKVGNLLDEQLDELYISLKLAEFDIIPPNTRIDITFHNTSTAIYSSEMVGSILFNSDYKYTIVSPTKWQTADGTRTVSFENNRLVETVKKSYLVATDNTIECPLGSGKYSHTLYLIEYTKMSEGFLGETLTFSNPVGDDFAPLNFGGLKYTIYLPISNETKTVNETISPIRNSVLAVYRNGFFSKSLYIPAFNDILVGNDGWLYDPDEGSGVFVYQGDTFIYKQVYIENSGLYGKKGIYETSTIGDESSMTFLNDGSDLGFSGPDIYKSKTIDVTAFPLDKDFTIKYIKTHNIEIKCNVTIKNVGYETFYPRKKYTISEVIQRLCDIIEPKTVLEKNRFRLNATQAKKYNEILAPEFTFTRMTFREQLQMIGGYIHAQPRIIHKKTASDEYDEIYFDEYGGVENSHIKHKALIAEMLSANINDWATSLDSNADNLVNQLNYASGILSEPSTEEFITLRSENATARLEEDNSTFIPTSLPIYKVDHNSPLKLICKYIPSTDSKYGKNTVAKDLTAYLFEYSTYQLFSSISDIYPTSKSYALYYVQGQPNIYGLFHKPENAVSSALANYAIVNILRKVYDDPNLTISANNYSQIGFEIIYAAKYSTRVKAVKQRVVSDLPRSINYNQSENLMETKYYGENLKGVIARLGNIEKQKTYHLGLFAEIPKVGTLYDENYYISAVSTEIFPTYIKCTIGLSKDFNRLSEFVGVSSYKRQWQVSEQQVYERQSVYTEYLKFSLTDKAGSESIISFGGENKARAFTALFFPSKATEGKRVVVPTSNAMIYNTLLKTVSSAPENGFFRPAVPIATGNTLTFTTTVQDNYSIGQSIDYVENYNGISGWFGNYTSYADEYGEIKYMNVVFSEGRSKRSIDFANALPNANEVFIRPDGDFVDANITGWVYEKDNREIPQISYELCAVTDTDDLIIGSALMGNSAFVDYGKTYKGEDKIGNDWYYKLVLLKTPINKLTRRLDSDDYEVIQTLDEASLVTNVSTERVTKNSARFILPMLDDSWETKKGNGWAIITPPNDYSITVSNRDGELETQTIYDGGELVLGSNKPYKDNQIIYITLKRDIKELL